MELNEDSVRNLFLPNWGSNVGFESYQLTNNNAKIKQAKKRLRQLEALGQHETKTTEIEGICRVVENVEENRVQFLFDEKPSEAIRTILKSHAFKWSRYNSAWQRQLNNNGIYSARLVLKKLKELTE